MRWIIWALSAFFYLYAYMLLVAPSMLRSHLMETFQVNGVTVAALSSLSYGVYALMQLPVGMMTDRYGARLVLAFAAMAAGIGALFFGLASKFAVVASGRLLMGFGVSFAFVGMLYICTRWFDPKIRGLLIGFSNSIGMLGAVLGQGPLGISIRLFGWRMPFFVFAITGIVLGLFIFLLVRNDLPKAANISEDLPEDLWKSLRIILQNKYSWINGFVSLFIFATTSAFASFWGVSFLRDCYQFSSEKAGFLVSLIFVGWIIGGPIIGIFSDQMHQKKWILLVSSLLGALLMSILVYIPSLPTALLIILLFFLGGLSSAQLLNFSYAIDINPYPVKGTAIAFTNLLTLLGAVAMQPLVGYLLHLSWSGTMASGVPVYSPSEYRFAMSCFPLSFLLSFALGLLLRRIPR